MKYRIIEEIYELKKIRYLIRVKGFFGWRNVKSSDGFNQSELSFGTYEEAEDYLKNKAGSGCYIYRSGNLYTFKPISYGYY